MEEALVEAKPRFALKRVGYKTTRDSPFNNTRKYVTADVLKSEEVVTDLKEKVHINRSSRCYNCLINFLYGKDDWNKGEDLNIEREYHNLYISAALDLLSYVW